MAEQFNVSSEQRKVLEDRARRRVALRNEFMKLQTDPLRHASGEGGTVVSLSFHNLAHNLKTYDDISALRCRCQTL